MAKAALQLHAILGCKEGGDDQPVGHPISPSSLLIVLLLFSVSNADGLIANITGMLMNC